mgnify:CR=1 FL=1
MKKKILSFLLVLVLMFSVSLMLSKEVAADEVDFIEQGTVEKITEIETSVYSDFEIEGTTLKKYTGHDAMVTVPQGIETIGYDAFRNCAELETVELPASLVTIDRYAFDNCAKLRSVKIAGASDLSLIGHHAFSNCPVLTSFTAQSLPRLKNINYNAFEHTSSLTRFPFETCTALETVESHAFNHSGLRQVKFSDALLTIKYDAFRNCAKLETVELPASVETIERYAFADCKNLSDVELGNVVTMGEGIFAGTNKINYVVLPASLTSTGWLFDQSEYIQRIDIDAVHLALIDGRLFKSVEYQIRKNNRWRRKDYSKQVIIFGPTFGPAMKYANDNAIPYNPYRWFKQDGWVKTAIGQQRYYSDGLYIRGLQKIGKTTYLFNDYGDKQKGWHVCRGIPMYFSKTTGGRLTGLRKIGKTTYLLTDKGKEYGWHVINGVAMYFDPAYGCGRITGKRRIGNTTYLLTGKYGKMTGWHVLNGRKYYFDPNYGGGMVTGLRQVGRAKYFFRTKSDPGKNNMGAVVTNQTITWGGHTYKCGPTGIAVKIK